MDKSDSKMYINEFGTKVYRNSKGEYHRLDGPALEWVDGTKIWYQEDKLHRLDGPAIEKTNGDKFWYILYKGLEQKEFNSWIFRIQKYM